MKRVLQFVIRLYPAWWRSRYGGELEALLEDSGSRSRDTWDLLRGAMQMQMPKWSFGLIVAGCGIAGVLSAGFVPITMPHGFYRSTAILRIPAGDRPIDQVNEAAQAALSRNSLVMIVNNQSLYPRERQRMPMEDLIDSVMRPAIQISPAGPGLAAVRFSYSDPSVAQRVTEMLTVKFAGFQIIDPAGPAKNEMVRARMLQGGIGLLAGLTLGAVLALILRRRAPTR